MAGVASAQIAPNGDVWTCCIRAESVGNLREHNYDFRSAWTTVKAYEMRRSIKAGECHCPLANASYTNMLCHVPTLTSVATEVSKGTITAALSPRAKSRTLPVINTAGATPIALSEQNGSAGTRTLPVINTVEAGCGSANE
jgi:hypothetical protein